MEILTTIFETAKVMGIPLLVFVLGLVQFIKSYGLKGNAVKTLSMGIGLVLGIGYQFSIAAPSNFAQWFGIVLFGLALGLVASGVYEVANPST